MKIFLWKTVIIILVLIVIIFFADYTGPMKTEKNKTFLNGAILLIILLAIVFISYGFGSVEGKKDWQGIAFYGIPPGRYKKISVQDEVNTWLFRLESISTHKRICCNVLKTSIVNEQGINIAASEVSEEFETIIRRYEDRERNEDRDIELKTFSDEMYIIKPIS